MVVCCWLKAIIEGIRSSESGYPWGGGPDQERALGAFWMLVMFYTWLRVTQVCVNHLGWIDTMLFSRKSWSTLNSAEWSILASNEKTKRERKRREAHEGNTLRTEVAPNAATKLGLLLRNQVMASVLCSQVTGSKERTGFIVVCNSAVSPKS